MELDEAIRLYELNKDSEINMHGRTMKNSCSLYLDYYVWAKRFADHQLFGPTVSLQPIKIIEPRQNTKTMKCFATNVCVAYYKVIFIDTIIPKLLWFQLFCAVLYA